MSRLRTLMLAVLVLGCGGGSDGGTGPAAVALVSIAPGDVTLTQGDTKQFTATDEDAHGNTLTGRAFAWSSTNTGVAGIAANGGSATVTAVAPGTADIIATSEEKADTVHVTVTAAAASVSLTAASTDTLRSRGDTVRLTAVAKDAGGATITGAPISFTSTRTSVATIDAHGLVTAVDDGRDSIVAQSGTAKAFVIVNVRRIYQKLVLSPNPLTVTMGSTATMTATPQDARGAAIAGLPAATFTSTDQTKATVSASGVVTPVAVGTARIIASLTAADGTHADTANVTVQAQSFPLTATVDMVGTTSFNPSTVDIAAGGSVTFRNNTGITHNVTFTSSNPPPPAGTGNYSSGSKTITFPTAGSYSYECSIHPNMTGTVRVH